MKVLLLLAIVATAIYVYSYNSAPAVQPVAVQPARKTASSAIIVAAAPSYRERWKTGPNAQTDLKTGPNAQTDFEPFAPLEQANWNKSCGYTIVSGANIPVRMR